MRLFIAIDFNELNYQFIELQKNLPKEDVKLTLTKRYHLTLKFLGEVSETDTEKIIECLKKIKLEEFEINLDEIGVFPNENYVRVVWVGVNPKEKIIELQKSIEEALSDFGFKKDFKFHPHITLARVKFIKDKPNFIDALKKLKIDKDKKIMAKEFKLIKSTLSPEGPIYEDLEVFS